MDESDIALQARMKEYAENTSGIDAALKAALLRIADAPPAATLDDEDLRRVICEKPKEASLASPQAHH